MKCRRSGVPTEQKRGISAAPPRFLVSAVLSADRGYDVGVAAASSGDDIAIGVVIAGGVAIGVAANAGSFPITVGLRGDTRQLGNGSTASVDIITSAAEDALTVPTSAVAVTLSPMRLAHQIGMSVRTGWLMSFNGLPRPVP